MWHYFLNLLSLPLSLSLPLLGCIMWREHEGCKVQYSWCYSTHWCYSSWRWSDHTNHSPRPLRLRPHGWATPTGTSLSCWNTGKTGLVRLASNLLHTWLKCTYTFIFYFYFLVSWGCSWWYLWCTQQEAWSRFWRVSGCWYSDVHGPCLSTCQWVFW